MIYFLECDCLIRPTIYIIKTVYNINKVIAGVIIFFIFIVVDLSLTLLEKNNVDVGDWLSCWQNPGTVDSSCTNKQNQGGNSVNGGIDPSKQK